MTTERFKRKKFAPSDVAPRFPVLRCGEKYVGVFNNRNVTVADREAADVLYNEGTFGKGSLSRSAPTHDPCDSDIPEILFRQQWENRLKWSRNGISQGNPPPGENSKTVTSLGSIRDFLESAFSADNRGSWAEFKNDRGKSHASLHRVNSPTGITEPFRSTVSGEGSDDKNDKLCDAVICNMVEEILQKRKIKESNVPNDENVKMVLVAETSDDSMDTSETSTFSNLKVKLERDLLCIRETLKLDLSEAFFLCFALGCLKVINQRGREMNVNELWKEFCDAEENFVSKYIAYHHYRSFGWSVKSGLKFGGDYLLYKTGPAYFHASYLVWILDNKNKMTWREFLALNRLVETFNKDLILCEIIGSDAVIGNCSPSLESLTEFSILQIKTKRWIPSQERDAKKLQEN